MPICMTDEQRALSAALRSWAERARPAVATRLMETEPDRWRRPWADLRRLGVLTVAAPESVGGGGGTVTDLAVALEQCAAALVPGPVLTTALGGLLLPGHPLAAALASGERTAGIALQPADVRVDDGRVSGSARLVLGAVADGVVLFADAGGDWYVADATTAGITVLDVEAADFSRPVSDVQFDVAAADRVAGLTTDRVRELGVTLAAAEAAGVAAWCLRTAVDYATVREQFGRPIGSFQAIKHLCAEMLGRADVAAAVAWDAAETAGDAAQHPLAAAVAGSLALDAAVENAKDCIQVLGGIGYTWEHDAHLYLRRAIAARQFLGGADAWRARVTSATAAGARRTLHIEFDREDGRPEIRRQAETIAAAGDQQRRALADSGLLVPHWPRPHGIDASPAQQLIIDEELDRAGVVRPDLVIAGWALPTILKHGSPEQIERFAAPTLRGELTWCQLFSEPGAGSDLASLRTKAERVDGGWRLTGQKVWTSRAREADWGVCLARTNADASKHQGITYFLIDMSSPGLEIRPLREITGEALFNEVFLDGVFVPDALVVGAVDGGWPLARTTLAEERVAMGGGSSIGDAVERLVEQCVANGTTCDPVVAQRLGALIGDGLAGSLLDLRTTLRQLGGQDDGSGASVRKLIGVRHRQAVAEAALALAGPDGLIAGEALRTFLMTRCLSIAGGTTQVLSNVVAERILGLPRG